MKAAQSFTEVHCEIVGEYPDTDKKEGGTAIVAPYDRIREGKRDTEIEP